MLQQGPPASRFVRVYDPDVAVGPNPERTETKREQHGNAVRLPNRPQRKGKDTCGFLPLAILQITPPRCGVQCLLTY